MVYGQSNVLKCTFPLKSLKSISYAFKNQPTVTKKLMANVPLLLNMYMCKYMYMYVSVGSI